MKRIATLLTLLGTTLCALTVSAVAATQGGNAPKNPSSASVAVEQDYQKKISQPTACGNHPYLATFGNDYRTACDRFASEMRTTIRAAGAECDHVALASPTIQGTTAAEAMCVVRGGDVVLGLTTNTVSYLVIAERVERLPADRAEARAAIDAAIVKAIGAQQAASQQAANIRQESRQQQINTKRMYAVAGDLSARNKRCDKLVLVTKTSEGGGFTATCLNKGKEKQYKLSFSGLE